MVAKAFAYGLAFRAGILGVDGARAGRVGQLPVANRPIRPGQGQLLGPVPGRLQARQHLGSGLDVHGAGLGVSAGQFQARMSHETLNDPRRNPGGIGQSRRLASQGVEVEEQPGCIHVGYPGGFQVGTEHLGSLGGQREDGRVGRQRGHVGPQISGQVARKGQGRRVPVLRVGGFDRDAGGRPIERSGPDAGDLRVSHPGRCGQPVAECSRRAGHRLEVRASLGNLDEPGQFIEGDGPAVVPTILLRVVAGQTIERILAQPTRPLGPTGKGPDAGPVVVAGLCRSS
jgi:hypothetical protein